MKLLIYFNQNIILSIEERINYEKMLARKHSVILVSNRQTKCCTCTFRQTKKKKQKRLARNG